MDKRATILGAGVGMAMAAAAASLFVGPGSLPALTPRDRHTTTITRADEDYLSRRNRNRANKKLKAKLGAERVRVRVGQRRDVPHHYDAGQRLVNGMTNWQRSRWASAGYPGLWNGNVDADKVRPFAQMHRVA